MAKIATNNSEKLLEEQLEQALRRLAVQNGHMLTLTVNQLVRVCNSKRQPVNRVDSHHQDTVNVETLSHVSAVNSEDSGLCIRMVFVDRLYATCEDGAESIKKWVDESVLTPISRRINNFPLVNFQRVLHSVKIQQGEIMMA